MSDDNAWFLEAEHFAEALRGRRAPGIFGLQAVRNIATMEVHATIALHQSRGRTSRKSRGLCAQVGSAGIAVQRLRDEP